MEFKDLKVDRIYALTEDVTNPHPDRRCKRQPDMEVTWAKGTRFIAREEVYENTTKGQHIRVTWFRLEWIDRQYGRMYGLPVYPEREGNKGDALKAARVAAIMACLAPAEEDFKAFHVRLGMTDYAALRVLKQLCENGTLTREQVEVEYNTYPEDE